MFIITPEKFQFLPLKASPPLISWIKKRIYLYSTLFFVGKSYLNINNAYTLLVRGWTNKGRKLLG